MINQFKTRLQIKIWRLVTVKNDQLFYLSMYPVHPSSSAGVGVGCSRSTPSPSLMTKLLTQLVTKSEGRDRRAHYLRPQTLLPHSCFLFHLCAGKWIITLSANQLVFLLVSMAVMCICLMHHCVRSQEVETEEPLLVSDKKMISMAENAPKNCCESKKEVALIVLLLSRYSYGYFFTYYMFRRSLSLMELEENLAHRWLVICQRAFVVC